MRYRLRGIYKAGALCDRAALEARVINWNCASSHSSDAAPPGAGALRPSRLHFRTEARRFRAIAYLQNGESKLVSRNQRNLGFEALKRSLARLPVENAIIRSASFLA